MVARDFLRLALGGLLVCLAAGCCCEYDDDCYYDEECYWDPCCGWYCYDVHVCGAVAAGMVSADPAALDFSVVVVPQGDDAVAIGVDISGRYADGDTLLGVMLHGEQTSGYRRQSRKTTWWFYGVSAANVREIEVRLVGRDLSAVKALPALETGELEPVPGLREATQAETEILGVPDDLHVGAEIVVRAPGPVELSGMNCAGVALEIVRPDSSVTSTIVMAGETSTLTLDLPGLWVLRPIILAEDVQGFPSEDAVGLADVILEVAS